MTQRPNWFIGFPVSDAWVAEATAGLPPEIRTFHGEDMHITIAFLGPCGAGAAHAAWRALVGPNPKRPRPLGGPFSLTLGRILPFGNPARPSSLSAVPTREGGPASAFLTRHRDTLRQAAGLPPDPRTPRPHATIARLPRRGKDALRARALAWAEARPALQTRVHIDEVALYTWTDYRERQLFYVVERAPLDGASAAARPLKPSAD